MLNARSRLGVDAADFTREWLKVQRRPAADIAAQSMVPANPETRAAGPGAAGRGPVAGAVPVRGDGRRAR